LPATSFCGLRVVVAQPFVQLLDRIPLVGDRRRLEERELQPVAQIGAGTALGAAPRAHLDADAHLQRRVREALIPLGHLAIVVGAHADRPRPIEGRQQRHAAHRGVMRGQRAHARLDGLVGDQRRDDEARVLETGHEERQRALAAVAEAHVHLTEPVPRDLAGTRS
jgi:hypothetical protein